MYLDIPRVRRCLFCLPLRRGLLALGYLNLSYTISAMVYLGLEAADAGCDYKRRLLFRGNMFYAEASLLAAVYAVDAILFVVLLYGAHKKRVFPMKMFLVYGAVSTLAALLLNLCFITQLSSLEILLVFCGTVLQTYLLILVRSEIIKLTQERVIHYEPTSESGQSPDWSAVVDCEEDPGLENPTAALMSVDKLASCKVSVDASACEHM